MIDDSPSVGPVTNYVLASPAQWECAIHGFIDQVITFTMPRPSIAAVRHYCLLCVEDALLGAGLQHVWRIEDE